MSRTIEIDDALARRLDTYREEDQTDAELIEELLNIFEQSRFMREGYSE